jgi:hypothetical protein
LIRYSLITDKFSNLKCNLCSVFSYLNYIINVFGTSVYTHQYIICFGVRVDWS